MPNIEIKAKYDDLSQAKEIAERLKTDYLGILHQIDTYFETKQGRLKLREINNEEAQLIPYSKDYQAGPMKSTYSVMPVKDPDNVKDLFDKLLGTTIVVDKKREVFLIDNVRVHLDEVKSLGTFIEFEAVYEEVSPQSKEKEEKRVSELMDTFQIKSHNLLKKSYVDYFFKRNKLLSQAENLYCFENSEAIVAEFKRTDLQDTEDLEALYHWMYFNKSSKELHRLNFKSMEQKKRGFMEGSLNFTEKDVKFSFKNKNFDLKAIDLFTVSPLFIEEAMRYFSERVT